MVIVCMLEFPWFGSLVYILIGVHVYRQPCNSCVIQKVFSYFFLIFYSIIFLGYLNIPFRLIGAPFILGIVLTVSKLQCIINISTIFLFSRVHRHKLQPLPLFIIFRVSLFFCNIQSTRLQLFTVYNSLGQQISLYKNKFIF